jgi:hypothetical protein
MDPQAQLSEKSALDWKNLIVSHALSMQERWYNARIPELAK